MEQSTEREELLPPPEEVILRETPPPTPDKARELVRIYADPVLIGQALAAMEHSKDLLAEMQRIRSRMTWLIVLSMGMTLIIAALCTGLAMAGMA